MWRRVRPARFCSVAKRDARLPRRPGGDSGGSVAGRVAADRRPRSVRRARPSAHRGPPEKDMFIVGGFNVSPAEVENVLLCHPGIRHASVIGVPDRRLGQVGMAFVVLADDPAGNIAQEIIAWCREQMANYKVPRSVEVVSELPTNASGKVQRDVLRARGLRLVARRWCARSGSQCWSSQVSSGLDPAGERLARPKNLG